MPLLQQIKNNKMLLKKDSATVSQRIAITCFLLSALWRALPAQLPSGFAAIQEAANLDPTGMAQAPDGRLFILEKNGRVRIVRNGALLPEPFLAIPVDNYNERGLTGIAFDPAFDSNNYVYLFYTVPGANRNRVSRFTANGDYAIPGSERILLETDLLAGSIHNAGAMLFGSDGKLYIATGDGADAASAQRLNSLLGKILRINPDGSIPADNPFYAQTTGVYRAIWALGLRNPFSFAVQPGTGRMIACDVGSDQYEEVNLIERGANYGWPIIEGPRTWQTPPANYRDPLYAYSHSEGCSIIGAAFYNPATTTFPPRYHGKFFFADYCRSYIKILDPDTGQVLETFATQTNRPVAMLCTPGGDLYYLSRAGLGGGSVQDNTSTTDGSLWRVFYTGSGAPFVFEQPQSLTLPVGEDAVFRVAALGRQPLSYQWLRNGAPVPGATAPVLTWPNVQLSDHQTHFRCRISNADSTLLSLEAVLHVTSNTRPQVAILLPAAQTTYAAGDTLRFSGSATDQEDGALPPSHLSWRIDFHHDDHTHPALENLNGTTTGEYVIPRVGETSDNVWYRIHLTATDSEGLSRTAHRDVMPRKKDFIVASTPTGLPLQVDGKTVFTPARIHSVEGVYRVVTAQPAIPQGINSLLIWDGWSNGWPDLVYPFFAGQADTIRAMYRTQTLSIGQGKGLLGQYFERNAQEGFDGAPQLMRIDSVINFDWALGAPAAGQIRADNFLVRWLGEVQAPVSGWFVFHAITDDGVRLWVDDRLLIDQWVPRPETESSAAIQLEQGRRYSVRMEYFEAGGHAVARLWWSAPGIVKQPVPRSQLYPAEWPALNERFNVALFPVPARDVCEVKINTWTPETIPYTLYDFAGRELQRGAWTAQAGSNRFSIDIALIPPGVYALRLNGTVIKGVWRVLRV